MRFLYVFPSSVNRIFFYLQAVCAVLLRYELHMEVFPHIAVKIVYFHYIRYQSVCVCVYYVCKQMIVVYKTNYIWHCCYFFSLSLPQLDSSVIHRLTFNRMYYT